MNSEEELIDSDNNLNEKYIENNENDEYKIPNL